MDKNSRDLELISDGEHDTREKRRFPRLNLTTEQFRLGASGKIYPVADLSKEGMALRVVDRGDLVVFGVGAVIEGTLNLKREKYPVRARVRRLGGDTIGCQFEGLTPEVGAALEQMLDPAVLGKEMKPYPADVGSVVWYHGPSGADFLAWRGVDGKFTRLAVTIQGNYVHWEDEALVTGRVIGAPERPEVRGVMRFETLTLSPDEAPDPVKLKIAKTLVLCSNLSEELKSWCSRRLEQAPGRTHG